MKEFLCICSIIFSITIARSAFATEQEFDPQKLHLYVEMLRGLEAPVDAEKLIIQLKNLLAPNASVKEAIQDEADPQQYYDVVFSDQFTKIRIQFDGSKSNLSMPKLNLLTANTDALLSCANRPIGFVQLRIGDLVEMYGPWAGTLDGNMREDRVSLFVFESGELKINAYGCYQARTKDIQVHMLSVKWPKPEWDKYYK